MTTIVIPIWAFAVLCAGCIPTLIMAGSLIYHAIVGLRDLKNDQQE